MSYDTTPKESAPGFDALVARITDEIYQRLSRPVRGVADQVCSDCVGQCAQRCQFKMGGFLDAGADRVGGTLGMGRPPQAVAHLIDHTLLKADAQEADVDKLCSEAAEYGFASVCVNPVFVGRCRDHLARTSVKVCTVIGFPLGATVAEIKGQEARRAQDDGAEELDMVIPVGLLKSGREDLVRDHVREVVRARGRGHVVKVIIETCLLSDDEKRLACRVARDEGADYVKTSTGFSTGGATVADIALMREVVGPQMGVKASGGVGDLATLRKMVAAGATRIGASAGVKIATEDPA